MSNLRFLARNGNPILRQAALGVDGVASPAMQELFDDLIATVVAANGVGIAAPQVAVSRRLFIVASRPNPRYPSAPTMEPTVMVNPQILARSSEMVKDWEGCLSVPRWRGLVPRHREIEVAYLNRHGEGCRQVLRDFIARIFQHELDRLHGILFVDRVAPQDLITEQEYQWRVWETVEDNL